MEQNKDKLDELRKALDALPKGVVKVRKTGIDEDGNIVTEEKTVTVPCVTETD